MNPYPFVELNHFTVPVAISVSKADQHSSRPSATRIAINLPSGGAHRLDRKPYVAYATVRKVWLLSSGATLIVVAVDENKNGPTGGSV